MAQYINPFTDEGFKRLFGQEEHKILLISFLNRLFAGEIVITDVTYLDKEALPNDDDGKKFVYDIYCTLDTGEHVRVEMQNRRQDYFKQRTIVYASRALERQTRRGDQWGYDELKAVYCISFLNFSLEKHKGALMIDGQIIDRKTGEVVNPYMRLIYIQIPEMTKSLEECDTDFERWIYLLKNVTTMTTIPNYLKANIEEIKYFEEVMDKASMTEAERNRYEESLKAYRDEVSIIKSARNEGLEIGEALGEAKANRKNAKGMKEAGVDVSIISQVTGLSAAEIAEL